MHKITHYVTSFLLAISTFLTFPVYSFASEAAAVATESAGHDTPVSLIFLFLAILLLAAKFGGAIERYGQPSVVGELFAGIILATFGFLGWEMVESIRHNLTMEFIAELGAVLLLFQIGLESNISQMKKVGTKALGVALLGVIVPFGLGTFVVGPWLFPEASQVAILFIGASMVATSVGITASIYQSSGVIKAKASQIVLGAAVIDDVLGLLVLAVVSAIASGGHVTPGFIAELTLKAVVFLGAAVALGDIMAKFLSKVFTKLNTGTGMKLALALTFALVYAYLASVVGLAPIVGAFAAGLVLDQVHFKNFDLPAIAVDLKRLRGFDAEEKGKIDRLIEHHQHAHVEKLIHNIGLLIIPVFFVFVGMMVDVSSLLNPSVYVTAAILSVAAIIGKLVSGFAAGGSRVQQLFIGTSMVPRGEVGLIFASVGKALGAIPSDIFSTILLTIIVTTLLPPTIISKLAVKIREEEKAASASS